MTLRAPIYLLSLPGMMWMAGGVGAAATPDFARDVRPILSNHCYQCHGPDDHSREAELRLDTPTGLNSVVDQDNLATSALLERILSHDADLQMPPAAANKPLSTQQTATIQQWILQGARWTEHWAFVKPERPEVPLATVWARNEIDQFAEQRMRDARLQPSPPADPAILVRRLYIDLTGLPPTPAQADKWLSRIWSGAGSQTEESLREVTADGHSMDEAAWQEMVTELLHSPAWAERWARRWLDLARYADTNGYEKDRDRSMWPWRDWVINALHAGMPFDQFTIEQLAGDMLPAATREQRVATGFHRNTMLNEEGGIDPLEYRFHAMTDRVATTGTTWLGLTLGCAQCHTHKYDPISHQEYYSFLALLNNADEPTLQLTDETGARTSQKRREQATQLLAELVNAWPQEVSSSATEEPESLPAASSLDASFAAWREREAQHAVRWDVRRPTDVRSTLPLLFPQPDGSIFASGDTAKRDEYWITLASSAESVTCLQLEVMPDDRLPAGGPGTTYYEGTIGDFFLNELSVNAGGSEVEIAEATESWAKDRYGKESAARLCIDGDVQTGWSVHDRIGERHVAVFQLADAIPPGTSIGIHMIFGRHFASSLGRFRFASTSSQQHPEARAYAEGVRAILATPSSQHSEENRNTLLQAFLLQAPELTKQSDRIRKLLRPPPSPTTLVLQERPVGQSRLTHRHHRGEFLQPQERVLPGTPAVLHELSTGPVNNRLALARWLVSPANPLTPRVVVNRHWAAIFGTGLVRTVDDFGLQGEYPSHPQLLDWLAVAFVEDDAWSLRKLHRRIVSSALYRQSATVPEAARSVDPDNRLLSHAPRYRLDAEVIRDRLLLAAGVYHEQLGGRSVFPPQPASVQEAAYRKGKWKVDEGPQRYRRSLYTFAKRTSPFAMLTTFDAPTGESCIARRNRSNNPLQALTLLNDVMFTELARHAGAAVARMEASDSERLVTLFRRVLTRRPAAQEFRALESFVVELRESYSEDEVRAAQLSGVDVEEGNPPVDHAVWTAVARALFALDETVMRE